MKVFILEGLPGSGKTTMSIKLSKELNFKRVSEIIDEDYNEINSSEILGVEQSFYLKSDKRKYKLAKKYSRIANVLVDRGFLSTFAYNLCLEKRLGKSKELATEYNLFKKLINKDIFYIFIEISPETSQKRKPQNKSKNNLWSYKTNLIKISRFYKKEFRKNNFNVIFINGERNYNKVYNEIKSKISTLVS